MTNEARLDQSVVSTKIQRISSAGAVVTMTVGSAAVWYFDPAKANFFPVCPLLALTGLACPGCGLTRGFHAVFHGDIIPALDFNLLVPVWAFIFGYVWISLLLRAVRGKGLPMWMTRPQFLWAFMIVLITFGVLRNIPLWPFTILFP
ncbi:MAG: DUF2752 domain-containing protein [Pyrinomonadaceae bacterium]